MNRRAINLLIGSIVLLMCIGLAATLLYITDRQNKYLNDSASELINKKKTEPDINKDMTPEEIEKRAEKRKDEAVNDVVQQKISNDIKATGQLKPSTRQEIIKMINDRNKERKLKASATSTVQ